MPDSETWKFINSFAPWFAALGTFTAALTALDLARRNLRQRLKLAVYSEFPEVLGVPYSKIKYADTYLTCMVVNNGSRDVTVVDVYWRSGWPGFWMTGQMVRHKDSTPLPSRIRDGETIYLRFDPRMFYESYLDKHANQFLSTPKVMNEIAKLRAFTVKAIVITSTGKQFSARVPPYAVRGFARRHELDISQSNT